MKGEGGGGPRGGGEWSRGGGPRAKGVKGVPKAEGVPRVARGGGGGKWTVLTAQACRERGVRDSSVNSNGCARGVYVSCPSR